MTATLHPGGRYCSGNYKTGCRCDYHLAMKLAESRRASERRAQKAGREYTPQKAHPEESTLSRGAKLLRTTMSADLTSRTYEPLSATHCGEERSPGHYCKRQIPCQVHGEVA